MLLNPEVMYLELWVSESGGITWHDVGFLPNEFNLL
jgi:hypothetical protein